MTEEERKLAAHLPALVYEALRFANFAAGEGFCPASDDPARDPAEFLSEFTDAMGHNDWEALAKTIRDALATILREAAEGRQKSKISEPTVLPDGSAFATVSFPLPKDHWLYATGSETPPMPLRMGEGDDRNRMAGYIREAARYAVRASTMNGKEDDFAPDAMVQNMVVGLIGYWSEDGAFGESWADPKPLPPLFTLPAPPPPSEEAAKAGANVPPTTAEEAIQHMRDDGDADPEGTAQMNYPHLFDGTTPEQTVVWKLPWSDFIKARMVLCKEATKTEPVPAVRVKRLKWRQPPASDTLKRCDTEVGTYRTWAPFGPSGKWFWSLEFGGQIAEGCGASEAEVQTAAQADYERRVLSALEPSPAQEPRGGPTPGACSCSQPADEEPVAWTVDAAWRDLVEKTDRTSPEEYPDHVLITRDELEGYMAAQRTSDVFKRGARAERHQILGRLRKALLGSGLDHHAMVLADNALTEALGPLPEDKEG